MNVPRNPNPVISTEARSAQWRDLLPARTSKHPHLQPAGIHILTDRCILIEPARLSR